ncbi:MAG: HU family DNA-binding protein [Minisyncoccia bacterium]|jgi:DNA-binding protein HU-beta
MNKKELISKVAEETNQTKKTVEAILDSIMLNVADALKRGEDVAFKEIGVFKIGLKKERKGRNPQTGKEIVIPASKVVKFKMAKSLKEAVNQ